MDVRLPVTHVRECWYDAGVLGRGGWSVAAKFGEAVRAHMPALRALALRLCRSAADADDLVQDTFERALQHFDQLAPDSNLRSWLLSVLHHRFIDLCRRRARRPGESPLEENDAPVPDADELPIWANITEDNVREAVAQLPADLRQAYDLCIHGKRTHEEIARVLGIATMTVGTRLLRARRRLRELLLHHTVDTRTTRSP
jgi:RNA polymerase sigma-70 factor (ECF subfamily)